MDITGIANIILLIVLLAATAFFVASEFAVVKIRTSRLDQLITDGNKQAIVAKKVVTDLDYYLSACQLGITVTSIGLGAFTKPYVQGLMTSILTWIHIPDVLLYMLSYLLALAIVSYLHVVIGEMAPKTLAIQFAEKLSLKLSGPLYWFGQIMKPFIKALNGASRLVLRMFGVKPAGHEQAYSEEELKIIMAQSFQGGQIDQTELQYLENVFSFDERVASDIMVPRTDLITIDKEMDYSEIIQILDEHNYTRYPITEHNDKDHIIGVVNAKKMLNRIVTDREAALDQYVRDVPFIVETTPLQDALLKMQKQKVHLTIVIDEYGGTAGILTMEDILEELVGEIRDEFDDDEVDDIRQVNAQDYIINGRVLLVELEDRFGLAFDDSEDIDTIGGWLQHKNIDILHVGDQFKQDNHIWTISEMDNYQIREVTFHQYKLEQTDEQI